LILTNLQLVSFSAEIYLVPKKKKKKLLIKNAAALATLHDFGNKCQDVVFKCC